MSPGIGASRNDRESPAGLLGTVVRGVGLSAGGFVLTQILTLAAYLVLARLATPEEFGQVAAASVLVGLTSIVVESGMSAALIHRPDRVDEAASTAVISTVLAGLGLGLLALAASPLVGAFFDDDTVAALAALMSGLIFLRAVPIVPDALLLRRFSFLRRVAIEPLGIIVFGVTATIATANGMGVWGLALGQYATAVTEILLSWGFAGWRPRLRLASFALWRELVDYGRHVFGATVVLRVGDQVPVALLGRFVGAAPLGQYHYARRVAVTPYAAILASASYVIFPAFARIAAEPARFRAAFMRSLRWMSAIAMPLGLILIPIGNPLVVLAFGETWSEAGTAVMALSVYAAVSVLSSLASEAFKAVGKPWILTRLHLVTTTATAACAAALLPFGLVGVCFGVSLGAAAGAAYALVMCTRTLALPFEEMAREIVPFAAAASLMAVALLGLNVLLDPADSGTVAGFGLLLVEVIAGIAIYAVAVHTLARGSFSELTDVIKRARRPGDASSPEQEIAVVEDQNAALEEVRLRE